MKNLVVLLMLSITSIVLLKAVEEVNFRLPKHVVPSSYKLHLLTHMKDKFNFKGVVVIKINVHENSNNITLHAKHQIESVELCSLKNESGCIKPSSVSMHDSSEFLVILFLKKIEVGEYNLVLSFEGSLIAAHCGLCAEHYQVNNTKAWYAVSNTWPIGTRRIFPCFDEPHFRTTFELIVVHDKRYRVISNTPLLKRKEMGMEVESVFEKTPPLSTFSFMVVVSEFVSTVSDDKRLIIWNRVNATEEKFDYEFLQKAVVTLETFFGLPLPSGKLNVFLIPENGIGDFSNWGTIVIRHKHDLHPKLYKRKVSMQTAAVITKLLVNQWIGQLVSPASWTDDWISLGASVYLEAYINEQILPDQGALYHFIHECIQLNAFSSHQNNDHAYALSQPRNTPEEILQKSTNRECKGGALIRMIQHMLTEKVFQTGLQEFLKIYSYKAASTNEFFDILNVVAGKHNLVLESDVKTIMNTWLVQKGYPVVTAVRNYAEDSAQLLQGRLALEAPNENDIIPKISPACGWWIPINYMQSVDSKVNETGPVMWMAPNENSQKINNLELCNPLIINKHQTGFYRVNYDFSNWKLIAKYLNSDKGCTQIPTINRAQLMADVLDFAKTNQLKKELLLDMTEYLHCEKDKEVWGFAFRIYEFLLVNSVSATYEEKLKVYLGSKMSHLKEDNPDIYNEFHMHSSCIINDSICVSKALNSLKEWADGHDNPNITDSLLCRGMKDADSTLWDKVYKKFLQSAKDDSGRILDILACTGLPENLKNLLSLGLTTNSTFHVREIFSGTSHIVESHDVDTILSFLLEIPTNSLSLKDWRLIAAWLKPKIANAKQLNQLGEVIKVHKLPIRNIITSLQESLNTQSNWFYSNTTNEYFENFFKNHQ